MRKAQSCQEFWFGLIREVSKYGQMQASNRKFMLNLIIM